MENQPTVSSYFQKKVITSLFNLLLLDDYKSPTFQVVDEIEVASLCDNFKRIIEQIELEYSAEYFLNQIQSKFSDKIQHQLLLMMISRPTFLIELSISLNFESDLNKLNEETFKIFESFQLNRQIHPLVKNFISEVIEVEYDNIIYDGKYINKEVYNNFIKGQVKKYKESLKITLD